MEKKINEGFWDAIVTQAKRAGLSAVSGVDSEAQGKLTALNLSTNLYNAYKKWLGETGEKVSPRSLRYFLVSEMNFTDGFAKEEGLALAHALDGTTPDDEPSDETANDSQSAQAPAGNYDLSFLTDPSFEHFKKSISAQGFSKVKSSNPDQYRFDMKADGSVIAAKPGKEQDLKKVLSSGLSDDELAEALFATGHMTTWAQFKSNYGSYIKDKEELAMFAKNSLMAAAKVYGKNYLRTINRWVIADPKAVDSSVELKVAESFIVEAPGMKDAELRDLFLGIAQRSLKNGEAKKAAKSSVAAYKKELGSEQGGNSDNPNQSATQQSGSQQAPQKCPNEIELAGVNLSDQEKEVLKKVAAGGTDLARSITGPDPDATKLAQKIILQSLRNLNQAST